MRPVPKKRTHNKRKLTEILENNYAIEKVKNERFFVRSGYVNKGKTWGQGNIAGNGDEGHILSGDHYRLFYTSHVNPSHIDLVYSWGHSLRCLAI